MPSGIEFRVHPLVLLNMSDHYTRYKAQQVIGEPPRVLGCLLGTHTGRTVDVANSFEIKYDGFVNGVPQLDTAFLAQKQEQYKKVFPKFDVVGWYATGAELQEADLDLQRTMMTTITESPLFVLFNPAVRSVASKDLPITLYESELHVVNDAPVLTFVKSAYTIETGEAERVAVDHVARIVQADASSSAAQLTSHLAGMQSAATMLAARVRVLHEYVAAVAAGTAPQDHALLREIAALLRQLPAVDPAAFEREYLTEVNDTLLMSYLTAMTKGTAQLGALAEKLNAVHGDRQNRRATRGFF